MKKDMILHTGKGTYIHRLMNVCSSAYERMFIGTWTYLTCVLRLFVLLFLQIMGNIKSTSAWRKKDSQCGRSALPLRSSKNKLFPAWESNVPSVGTNFSLKARFLRSFMFLLFLMLTLGIGGAWGQIERNYAGTYYIANANYDNNKVIHYNSTDNTDNYYLCPATNYYDGNAGQKPFMTTHKPDATKENENISKWKIVFASTGDDGIDYYYIKYVAPNGDEKYIVHNEQLVTNLAAQYNSARVRYHLQADKDAEEDNNLFFFTAGVYNKTYKEFINICSKAEKERASGASICPAKQNTDSYSGQNNGNNTGSFSIGSTNINCGGLIGHWDENDKTGLWFLEDVVKNPVVSINGDGKAVITSSDANATYKYSTDGNTPSTDYDSDNPIDITNVETIKAIAVLNGEESNVVTYTVGNGSPYLIQNQECTAYYMVPEQKESGNISINTSSVAGPKMEWYVRNAGAVNGLQYYYIVNKETSSSSSQNYLTYTASNGTNIYFASNSDRLPSGDTYKFYFRPNTDGSYSIYPKGVMDKSFHKDQGNRAYPIIVISANITMDQAKWKFIPSSDYAFVAPTDDAGNALTLSSESSGVAYYYVASVGTTDSYIVSSATTSNSGSDSDKSWMLVEATTDSWQKYYYIVSAATGKYMHFLGTASNISTLTNAVEMTDLPDSPTDNYKFVLARATEDNTYYIIPKTHYDCFEANKFYCLINSDSQINADLTRASKNNTSEDINAKWTFEPNSTLFCLDPIATQDNDGNVSLECPTIGAEIHYTDNGDTPTSGSGTFDPSTPWSPTDQVIIKAIAVLKNNTSITSENTITVLNNPDITLSQDTYTYDKTAHEPGITEVSYGGTTASSSEYSAPPSSYTDNINAGTANVTLEDVPGDNMYICNASKTFTINPAELEIVVNAMSKGYGDDDPVLTYTCSGIVEGDEISDVMTGALAREAGEAKGTYAINQGTLVSNSNYTIATFTGNDLTIEPKSLGSGITPAVGITIDDITKTGDAFSTPAIKHNNTSLTLGTDYEDPITITGNATTKYYDVTFTGRGNYTGSVTVRFANVNFDTKDNTSYFATFVSNSSDGDFMKPSNITPYIITGAVGNALTAAELNYIPENVPVVLMTTSAAANGFCVKVRSEGVADDTSGNLLAANSADMAVTVATVYLLYKGEFVLNAAGTLAAGKVYLPKTAVESTNSPAPARLTIRWDEYTGIENVQASPPHSQLSADWYTLDGRRLSGSPKRKGLYLRNGQKMAVK